MADDLELLAGLPDSMLTIELLLGTACRCVNGSVRLHTAGELKAWLAHRLSESGIEQSEVEAALVTAGIRTNRIARIRKRIISFDLSVDLRVPSQALRSAPVALMSALYNCLQATCETHAPET